MAIVVVCCQLRRRQHAEAATGGLARVRSACGKVKGRAYHRGSDAARVGGQDRSVRKPAAPTLASRRSSDMHHREHAGAAAPRMILRRRHCVHILAEGAGEVDQRLTEAPDRRGGRLRGAEIGVRGAGSPLIRRAVAMRLRDLAARASMRTAPGRRLAASAVRCRSWQFPVPQAAASRRRCGSHARTASFRLAGLAG